ncbi:MAG: class I SAM-dependent methyltransferase [Planctomycetes bacterium]|nr:class I SAM-dependent methyltransferase [Planctomycetota bacterium]
MQTRKPLRLGTRARLLLRGLRYAPLLPYASIDGWLSVDEAIALFELARRLPDERPVVVEIGSWQGKSSVVLAKGLVGKNGARLHCIDPFDGSATDTSASEYASRAAATSRQLHEVFTANLATAGVQQLVTAHTGRSHDFAPAFTTPIDLLFLDGDHAYDAVARDVRDWAPKVRPGGFLAMHDVQHPVQDGPRRVVAELLAQDPFWTDIRTVDTMWIARKIPAPTSPG